MFPQEMRRLFDEVEELGITVRPEANDRQRAEALAVRWAQGKSFEELVMVRELARWLRDGLSMRTSDEGLTFAHCLADKLDRLLTDQQKQKGISRVHRLHLTIAAQAAVWGMESMFQINQDEQSFRLQGAVTTSYDPHSDQIRLSVEPPIGLNTSRVLGGFKTVAPDQKVWSAITVRQMHGADEISYKPIETLVAHGWDLLILGLDAIILLALTWVGAGALSEFLDKVIHTSSGSRLAIAGITPFFRGLQPPRRSKSMPILARAA